MKWITTNIRFPEDLYLELKMAAAKRRSSLSQIVRERVSQKRQIQPRHEAARLMKKFDLIAKEIDRQNQGINLSDKLIEMRYEQ